MASNTMPESIKSQNCFLIRIASNCFATTYVLADKYFAISFHNCSQYLSDIEISCKLHHFC